jgi:hypothetical protein
MPADFLFSNIATLTSITMYKIKNSMPFSKVKKSSISDLILQKPFVDITTCSKTRPGHFLE